MSEMSWKRLCGLRRYCSFKETIKMGTCSLRLLQCHRKSRKRNALKSGRRLHVPHYRSTGVCNRKNKRRRQRNHRKRQTTRTFCRPSYSIRTRSLLQSKNGCREYCKLISQHRRRKCYFFSNQRRTHKICSGRNRAQKI